MAGHLVVVMGVAETLVSVMITHALLPSTATIVVDVIVINAVIAVPRESSAGRGTADE